MKYLLLLIILASTTCFAQKGERAEKIKAFKIAYITESLNLNSAEAEKFWPIYNVHQEKLSKLRKNERSVLMTKIENIENLSEQEALQLINESKEFQTKIFETEINLIENLKGVIPYKKIVLLKKTEEDFKRTLLERMRARRKERP